MTGFYSGSLAFGDERVTAPRRADAFIAKYSEGGELQWLFSSSGDHSSAPAAIAVSDLDNCVVVVGILAGTDMFGDVVLTAGDAADSYVVRLLFIRAPFWGKVTMGTGMDEALGALPMEVGNGRDGSVTGRRSRSEV